MYGRNGGRRNDRNHQLYEDEAGNGFEAVAARVHHQSHRRDRNNTGRHRSSTSTTTRKTRTRQASPVQHKQQQQPEHLQQPRLEPKPWKYNGSPDYFSGDLSEQMLSSTNNDNAVLNQRRDSGLWSERSNPSDDDGVRTTRNHRNHHGGGGLRLWEAENFSDDSGMKNDHGDDGSWKSANSSEGDQTGYVNDRLRSAGLCQPPTLESVALAEQYQISLHATANDDEKYSARNLNHELRGSSKHRAVVEDDNGRRVSWEPSFDDSAHDGGNYDDDDSSNEGYEVDGKEQQLANNGSYEEDLVTRYNTLSSQVLQSQQQQQKYEKMSSSSQQQHQNDTTAKITTIPAETVSQSLFNGGGRGRDNSRTEVSQSTNYEECDSWRQTPPGSGGEIYYNAKQDLSDSFNNLQLQGASSSYEETDSWRHASPEHQQQGHNNGNNDTPTMQPYPDLFTNDNATATGMNINGGSEEELNASGDIVYEEDISFTKLRNQLDSVEDCEHDNDELRGRTNSIGDSSPSPIRADKSLILSELRKESSKRSLMSSSSHHPEAPIVHNKEVSSRRTKGSGVSNNVRHSAAKRNNDAKSMKSKEEVPSALLTSRKDEEEDGTLAPYNSVVAQQQQQDQRGPQSQQHNKQSTAILQQRPNPSGRVPFEQNPETQMSAFNFASEHRIMLKAVLELLSQKDRYSGLGVDVNDPNTVKSGPLKKASHLVRGIWKIKYVEIRKGLFSYYEDAVSKDSTHDGELLRKNIVLQANLCKCRAVKVQQRKGLNSPAGAVFELAVEGRPRKLWMANSREERQAWLSAINDAMVGGSVIRGENHIDHNNGKKKRGVSSRSPYKRDLELYEMVQNAIEHAETKDLYIGAISGLGVQSLNVPVRWIMEQAETSAENAGKAFHEESTCLGVNQLWKDLLRDSVKINGEMFKGDTGHAPERIIGSLTRSIITNDRSKESEDAANPANRISESQALSYARDILLAGNRTRTGGDSYYCVDRLCKSDLVVLVPSTLEAEPLNITVEHIPTEKTSRRGSMLYSMHDRSGWLKTRSRPPNSSSQKPWKKRFFVLSEGSLSYYEKATPRPHGLRGQLLLQNAAIQVSEESYVKKRSEGKQKCYVVSLTMKDASKDRQLRFEDQKKFFLWAHALESVINQSNKGRVMTSPSVLSKLRLRPNLREEMNDSNNGEGNTNTFKEQAASLGLNEEDFARRGESLVKNAKGRSTVKVVIQACTEYKICTVDPQGDESEDTWASVRAKFLQSFRVGGGSNGRIIRGEEVVQMTVISCCQFGSIYERAEKVRQLNDAPEPPGQTPLANFAKATTPPASPSTPTNIFRSRSDTKGRRVAFFNE